ncbi:MAG: NAD(P)H-dependent oxidoreductase subunit E [Acidimicrobiia bacterium]
MSFSPANLERAREIIARYPRSKSAILPLAHLAQEQDGWLSLEAMEEIASLVGVTPAEVQGTCSFYTMFKRDPVGKLLVSVCTNVSCLVLGGPEVYEHLSDRYAGDPEVTVEEVECIAACDGAPCLQVNYEYHLGLTPESAEAIVEQYKRGELQARGISGGARA